MNNTYTEIKKSGATFPPVGLADFLSEKILSQIDYKNTKKRPYLHHISA